MMTFDKLWPFILEWEGGLCDDEGDPGGITKYGVSIAFLKDIDERRPDLIEQIGIKPPVTRDTIKRLTKDQAKELFREYFWTEAGCDKIAADYPRLAACVCDTGINMGRKVGKMMLQEAVGATADGVWGPKTMAALRATGDVLGSQNFIQFRRLRYQRIVDKRPSSQKFLKGWYNRVSALQAFIGKEVADD